jgi:hypothetical protein
MARNRNTRQLPGPPLHPHIRTPSPHRAPVNAVSRSDLRDGDSCRVLFPHRNNLFARELLPPASKRNAIGNQVELRVHLTTISQQSPQPSELPPANVVRSLRRKFAWCEHYSHCAKKVRTPLSPDLNVSLESIGHFPARRNLAKRVTTCSQPEKCMNIRDARAARFPCTNPRICVMRELRPATSLVYNYICLRSPASLVFPTPLKYPTRAPTAAAAI